MKFLFFLLIIFTSSCRSLPYDTSPAPISHNKMTLEIQACGKQEVGLNGCFYGDDLTESVKIPLWGKGEYQIKSERCQFFENKRYEKAHNLEISFENLLSQKPEQENSCLYNIKVFIDGFDNGFEGFFLLSKGDLKPLSFEFQNKSYLGYGSVQIREGNAVQGRIKVLAESSGIIMWEGCQLKGQRKYGNNPEINFQEIISGTPVPNASCILTMGIIPDNQYLPIEYGKFHINVYEKVVQPLVEPSFFYENEKLTVTADKMIAVISIGEYWTFRKGENIKRFTARVPKDEEVDVRLATSNGRFMLLKVKNGKVLWIK
jgi:hypothetical protein